jgi:aminopeptidase N
MTRPMLRRTFVGALTALLLAVPTAAPTTAVPTASAPGVGSPSGGDRYYPRDGNGGYDVRHYGIKDTYRPGTGRLSGRTVVQAVATRDLRVFHLDLALVADAVRVDGRRASFRKPNPHSLRIRPAEPLERGERFAVRVRYHGNPSRATVPGYGSPFFRTRTEGLAMGQPQIGPWWFAANETPADKATYRISIRVPRGREAVSNGELVGPRKTKKWTTWRWRMDDPMTTYAAFFYVGDLELRRGTADGRPYVYAVSKRVPERRRHQWMRRLERTAAVTRWLEGEVGRYPFTSIGGVAPAVRASFALETQSRPVYPASWGPARISLLVHEMAHQWFGNSLAVTRWRDIWLNEGLATYYEWLWSETHGGKSTHQLLRAAYDSAPAKSRFWDVRIGAPGPSNLFAWPVYDRGAMTVAALRNVIGDGAHVALIRRWVAENAHGNVTGEQFRRLAEDVSGRQLDGFFREWLDERDRPADTAANGLR